MPPAADPRRIRTSSPARLARRGWLLAVAALVGVMALPAGAHTYGTTCASTPTDTCEAWSAVLEDTTIAAPARSDQFPVATLVGASSVYVVSKDVALNTDDPYSSRGKALVVAYSRQSGVEQWRSTLADSYYINPNTAVLSPDGSTLYITGGSYDAYVLSAKTSRVMTAAFNTSDGSTRWSKLWNARPDGRDNGTTIATSWDGSEVYVGAVTTPTEGGLDMALIGYSAGDGRQLFSSIYSGPKTGGSDSPFGIGVSKAADMVYLAGWSDATAAEYDADYATVAFALGHQAAGDSADGDDQENAHGCKNADRGNRHDHHCDPAPPAPPSGPVAGQQMWVARYDGIGAHRSDRANALAVDPTGKRVYVTGDSYSSGGAGYGYGTVAYDAVTGNQLWQARFDGGRGGFNSATQIATTAGAVLVSGQATAPDASNGNDATTVAYDSTTGRQLWLASVAPARSDDYARALETSPDGRTAYLLTTDLPIVNDNRIPVSLPGVALSRLGVAAFDMATGATRWTSTLDGGLPNALSGDAMGVSRNGDQVVVAGTLKRSANPLGEQSQNIYDAVVAAYAG